MAAVEENLAATFFELVLRYGYRRATLDDVARLCRVSKKTIYDRFPSKEILFEHALDHWARGQRASVEARLTTAPADQLREVVAFAFADARAAASAGPSGAAAPFMEEPFDIVTEVNERVFAPMVVDLIRRGNAEGAWHVEDPETTARFCVVVGIEAVNQLRRGQGRDPEAAALTAMLRLIGAAPEA